MKFIVIIIAVDVTLEHKVNKTHTKKSHRMPLVLTVVGEQMFEAF